MRSELHKDADAEGYYYCGTSFFLLTAALVSALFIYSNFTDDVTDLFDIGLLVFSITMQCSFIVFFVARERFVKQNLKIELKDKCCNGASYLIFCATFMLSVFITIVIFGATEQQFDKKLCLSLVPFWITMAGVATCVHNTWRREQHKLPRDIRQPIYPPTLADSAQNDVCPKESVRANCEYQPLIWDVKK